LADTVAKVENRSALKISREPIFGRSYLCKALHGGYEDRWWVLREMMWSLTSAHAKSISGHLNFRSSPEKDFFNTIGTNRTS
jgi:hypothetical protein